MPVALIPAAARATVIPRWAVCDLPFASDTSHANPFLVPFSASARGPSGLELGLPGFFDGNGTWKIRFSPPAIGEWTLTTSSTDEALNARTVRIRCATNEDPNVHGGLLVDPEHPYHFVHEDGTRHFLSGYECDWLWALPQEKLVPFLDRLKAHGFNHILLNAYAHDCHWRKGATGPDDYGPPDLYPWGGDNNRPDFSRLNLEYWRHYDGVIEALCERGITAHIMIKVYNKMVRWPDRYSPEEEMYFRWLIARYSAFPNVIWDFSKETYNEKNVDYKISRFRLIRRLDPYGRLVTCHDDHDHYDKGTYDAYLDFESDQQHSHWHEVILKHRARRACPAVNVEYGYEHGPGGSQDKTYGVVQAPEEVLRRAWLVYMAGGYGAYYYTNTAWDIIRPEETPPGYVYFAHLAAFFARTGYWSLEPGDDLVEPGHCLARPGQEYIVYLPTAEPFVLHVSEADRLLPATWFNPLTGQTHAGVEVANGANHLTPPWSEGPAALHVGQPPSVKLAERLSCMIRHGD